MRKGVFQLLGPLWVEDSLHGLHCCAIHHLSSSAMQTIALGHEHIACPQIELINSAPRAPCVSSSIVRRGFRSTKCPFRLKILRRTKMRFRTGNFEHFRFCKLCVTSQMDHLGLLCES